MYFAVYVASKQFTVLGMLITVTKGCDKYAVTCNCSIILDGSSVQTADKAMCLEQTEITQARFQKWSKT